MSLQSQNQEGEDRWIFETHWPADLVYLASYRPVRDRVSKIKVVNTWEWRQMLSSNLHIHVCTRAQKSTPTHKDIYTYISEQLPTHTIFCSNPLSSMMDPQDLGVQVCTLPTQLLTKPDSA